ncbi:BH3 interacting domain death agonist [Homo sapiens]|uniref:BH3-interacting domain death agonist n=2 Tax=Homininae TaxID=207598 RepID=A0A2I3SGG1_PANTR|nr:BID S [Homo sapiens]EAW57772.1 BH3 interacting domain death agonist, isoform CRA_c [Homo sapiens]KAI2596606.1 BH3 interacting domain death agonist [Homo sapiens]KAI4001792.1 BH3 interacting domain death agonist [Homo sapiens]
MDCEVNNGSSLRDECITNLLVFGFLQSCSDNSFRRELDALGHELPVLAPQWEGYDELQTDGNRSSHSRLGRIEAGASDNNTASAEEETEAAGSVAVERGLHGAATVILKVKKTSSGILPGTSPRSGTAWTVASLRAW